MHAGLTIGTEQSFYSVREDEGSLEICIDVLYGSIPSDDTYTISYSTSESAAEGNLLSSHILIHQLILFLCLHM